MKFIFLITMALIFEGCSKSSQKISQNPLFDKGKAVFISNCIACHNTDPTLPGSIGPDIANSSIELLTSRIMKQSYPEGYKPKRDSHLMPALPFLEKDLPALKVYLDSFTKK